MNRLPNQWKLDELLRSLAVSDVPSVEIAGLSLDSRLVEPGDAYLAVAGSTTHGIRFADAALEAGAVAVLVDSNIATSYQEYIEPLVDRGVPLVRVPSLDQRCAQLAARFYDSPDSKMTLIAVTGTDGKTSVCRFIASALTGLEMTCGYIGTLGWGRSDQLLETSLTTPDVVSLRRMLAAMYIKGVDYVALEASSHGLAEGRLDGLSIDIAVLTNFGRDHLDYHKTLQAYREAKTSLFTRSSVNKVILNGCDSLGCELVAKLEHAEKTVYCQSQSCLDDLSDTLDAVPSNVVASNITTSDTGLGFSIDDAGYELKINSPIIGKFNVDNLLACYACLRTCGVAANDAAHALQGVSAVPGRMERLGGKSKPTIVIDYCHTPQALSVAISAVQVHCKGQLWVVFGCGGDRDKGKRAPMAKAAEVADYVVLTDDNPRTEASSKIIQDTLAGFESPQDVLVISDRAEAIRHAITAASAGDLVLIAGKGHEDYQIIGEVRFPFSDREHALCALELAS
ncbi:MAG: UDP-N-acetylmuramoyl-L-alanyl-D-glutamate--2,6-diaminopimelate ligase [Granulosicoccus sp.]|nr:UDP-N-acetylmuramoyl-L-alanyl-D-glutamate--2,6-diaminopimelate ligase [Granulosicoccus sp.]